MSITGSFQVSVPRVPGRAAVRKTIVKSDPLVTPAIVIDLHSVGHKNCLKAASVSNHMHENIFFDTTNLSVFQEYPSLFTPGKLNFLIGFT